jgi:Ca2+-binding EF-hand superfamily protein
MELFLFQQNEKLMKIAFESLDYNNDGYISEIDLFLTMKEIDNNVFFEIFARDYVKIIKFISRKKKQNKKFDE